MRNFTHKIIFKRDDLDFSPGSLPSLPQPKRVMMVSPKYFDVENALNPHMQTASGELNKINHPKALAQWESLKKTFQDLHIDVLEVAGKEGLPDMVFCANQSFPFVDAHGKRHAILSNMFHASRHKEVNVIAAALEGQGYTLHQLPPRGPGTFFESMGDALWLGSHRMVLGGYGFRTDKNIYQEIAKIVDAPVALFELKHAKFYHLDTCLSVLNSKTALACPDAFTKDGWELLGTIFESVIKVPFAEADSPHFACNAHCPDEKHVVIQRGCSKTMELLKSNGFVPIEVDTSEFIKSGGSVFCMKLMFY